MRKTTFLEHRLLRFAGEGPSSAPVVQSEVDRYISADMAYMEQSFKLLVASLERRSGQSLSEQRAQSVELRRASIQDRLQQLQKQYFESTNRFHAQRNQLVDEVHALKSYVEFQLAQQREEEREPAQKLDGIERDIEGTQERIWIPINPGESTRFTYVSNNPQVSRVLGTIGFDANTISSRMPGTYFLQRATHEGKSYLVLKPDPSFSGTFTFMTGNRRSTIEVRSSADRARDAQRAIRNRAPEPPRNDSTGGVPEESPKLPNRTFEPGRTIDWSLPENYLAYQSLQARILDKTNQLAIVVEQSRADPLNEVLGRRVEGLTAELKVMNDFLATISPPAKPSASTETRPDISRFITSAREKTIYTWLRNQTNTAPMWYQSGVPDGKPGCEYMIGSDGHLFARYATGATVTQRFVFENEKWREFPR